MALSILLLKQSSINGIDEVKSKNSLQHWCMTSFLDIRAIGCATANWNKNVPGNDANFCRKNPSRTECSSKIHHVCNNHSSPSFLHLPLSHFHPDWVSNSHSKSTQQPQDVPCGSFQLDYLALRHTSTCTDGHWSTGELSLLHSHSWRNPRPHLPICSNRARSREERITKERPFLPTWVSLRWPKTWHQSTTHMSPHIRRNKAPAQWELRPGWMASPSSASQGWSKWCIRICL